MTKQMTGEELKTIIEEVYGRCGQIKLARDIHLSKSSGAITVSRWVNGITPVRPVEACFIRLIRSLHKRGIAWNNGPSEVKNIDDLI